MRGRRRGSWYYPPADRRRGDSDFQEIRHIAGDFLGECRLVRQKALLGNRQILVATAKIDQELSDRLDRRAKQVIETVANSWVYP
jgi:hypothetical protein